jgi:hypothetical protein
MSESPQQVLASLLGLMTSYYSMREQPLLAGDRVGLRAGGAELAFRDFLVKGKYQVVEITGNVLPVAEQRAIGRYGKTYPEPQ